MQKRVIESIHKKNSIALKVIERLCTAEGFLMLGHENPDEDCIAAMVSFGLLASKFEKRAAIYVTGKLQEQHNYLLDICQHNMIDVYRDKDAEIRRIDTMVVCDTPKPSMVAYPESAKSIVEDPDIVTIEFDHHIAADSEYIGDPEYALVTEASSACELVGYIALKLCNHPAILEQFHIKELLSRNLVLAILTGIIGDSKMGKFLKSRRERRFYAIFTGLFNDLLTAKTNRSTNYSNKDEVFNELIRLSDVEEACFSFLMSRADERGPVAYVVLDESTSKTLFTQFELETVVSVSRSVADALAERSTKLSMTGYYDTSDSGENLVQFRVRRSQGFKWYDVRRIIDLFEIKNGGGHEGAIGFRFDRAEVGDIVEFADRLLEGITKDIDSAESAK